MEPQQKRNGHITFLGLVGALAHPESVARGPPWSPTLWSPVVPRPVGGWTDPESVARGLPWSPLVVSPCLLPDPESVARGPPWSPVVEPLGSSLCLSDPPEKLFRVFCRQGCNFVSP